MSENSLQIRTSRQFESWLGDQGSSLAFTTYQAGKLFLVGLNNEKRLSVFERTFNRCMGLWSDGQTMWMSSLYQLWRFENSLDDGETYNDYDAVFSPQQSSVTGDVDVHDLALNDDGDVVFVNTLFSCLATPSETHSFKPLWQPPFISRLAAEDRCHMNGLAMRDGQPRYVSIVGKSDMADGWRIHRQSGGIVMDVTTGDEIVGGLSMPHSPRWHRDTLWLLESGAGYFGRVDMTTGKFERLAFCPGYLRGMSFLDNHAIVAMSHARDGTFADLPISEKLDDQPPRCGLYIIDLDTGDVRHWLHIEGVVQELYDVTVLPGIKRPMAIGFMNDEICRAISIE